MVSQTQAPVNMLQSTPVPCWHAGERDVWRAQHIPASLPHTLNPGAAPRAPWYTGCTLPLPGSFFPLPRALSLGHLPMGLQGASMTPQHT